MITINMSTAVKLALALCLPVTIASVTVEIDGFIDLGPKLNYAYSIKPKIMRAETFHMKSRNDSSKTKEVGKQNREDKKTAVTLIGETTDTNVFKKPHAVKDDKDINDFTFHIYQQSLKVFDTIKKKLDPKIWPKLDYIARSYDNKFKEFVEDTMNQNIKTNLGTQKVVLNTIDTSDHIMKRLVNYLLGEISKDTSLRAQSNILENVLQKEVEKETYLEYRHVCTKFGICRTALGFDNFIVDILTIILKGNDIKVKQASDAFTEVLKTTDFSNIMTKPTKDKFKRLIYDIETWDTFMTRAMFMIMKNLFALKNQPLKVMMDGKENLKNTVVMLEIIDELDNALPPNEENILTWTDLTNSLNQWQDGKRDDLLEIVQNLISHVNHGIKSMSKEKLESMKQKFGLILN